MSKQQNALRLALAALENAQANFGEWWPEAITALREALAEQPASKPLTDEQIDALREKHSEGRGAGWRFNFKGFARAIEAAHGIKGGA